MTLNTNYIYIESKIRFFNATKTKFNEMDHLTLDDGELEFIESDMIIIRKNRYKLIIGITMYSEGYYLIDSTLNGICKNLNELNKTGLMNNEILIVIISDGREKVNSEVLSNFLGSNLNGLEEKIDQKINENIFSDEQFIDKKKNYLISCWLKREHIDIFKESENESKVHMDVLFSIKKNNCGKLDSYFWFFMGFCKRIDPSYIILLDAGTVPNKAGRSLSSLIIPMMKDHFIAGTCGEIGLSNNSNCTNFVLSAQFLEYKYTHVIDKNFESLFGLILNLPGAYSAYRWKALKNIDTLEEYFRSVDSGNANCQISNSFLAEERILCFNLFFIKDERYILKYIPDAKAKTDAPEIYGEFMLQRRRWINGSNFALYNVLSLYSRVCNSKHCFRQLFIFFLFIYYAIQVFLGYFFLGTLYFIFWMICNKNLSKDSIIPSSIMLIYLFLVIFCVIASLTIKPKRELVNNTRVIFSRTTIFAIVNFILLIFYGAALGMGIYTILTGGIKEHNFIIINNYYEMYNKYNGVFYMIALGILYYLLPVIYEPSMIGVFLKNIIQYLSLQPTYAIIFNIFAICNIDDHSWGNRDSNFHCYDDDFKIYKIKFLFVWVILNFILGHIFSFIVTNDEMVAKNYDKNIINVYSYLISSLFAFKLILAFIGKIKYIFIDKCCRGIISSKNLKKNFIKIQDDEEKNIQYGEEKNFQNEEEKNIKDIEDKKNEIDDVHKKNDEQNFQYDRQKINLGTIESNLILQYMV